MSKFLELVALLPKAIKNPEAIIEGWRNNIKLNNGYLVEDEVEEILRRRAICHSCPLNSINSRISEEYKELMGENYKTDRDDLHCSICLCNIDLKTASLESDCGLTWYNEEHSENKQPLKWEKYKK